MYFFENGHFVIFTGKDVLKQDVLQPNLLKTGHFEKPDILKTGRFVDWTFRTF
jgi:hypothetical protein